WHAGRALVAGLIAGKLDYDPPLYYLVNLPIILLQAPAPANVGSLMAWLMWSNLVYLCVFYAAWIYVIFPRALPGWRSSAAALLVLRETWAQTRASRRRFVAWAAALMLLVGTVSSSWYVYRGRTSDAVLDAYNTSYVGAYQAYKPDFDFGHYFGSFYFRELLA